MRELSGEHRRYLNDHAITDALLSSVDVFSIPLGIVFGWYDGTSTAYTLRPDFPDIARPKYEWPEHVPLRLWQIRENDCQKVLLIEGHKQSLAVASWAGPDYSVYAMNGCWGTSGADLTRFTGRDVFVILDSDAGSSHDVYEAGVRTAAQLKDDGAAGVRFVRVNGSRKEGADDRLALIEPAKRPEKIDRWVELAKNRPADRRPPRPRAESEPIEGTADRPLVVVNADRLAVVDQLHGLMGQRWNGTHLFNFGNVLTRLRSGVTEPLTKDALYDAIQNVATTVRMGKESHTYEWPDTGSMTALLYRAHDYLPLTGVSRVPFVRPDGTICQDPGYDVATGVFLDQELGDVYVPDNPTWPQVEAARDLLLNEWLGDMPFPEPTDRANALALVLTPLIRKLVPLVPLAVVDGLQMGVGKNLFADMVAILATGKPASPLPYSQNDEETRKVITSAFRSGSDLFVFDEAHELSGPNFARAITSVSYQDRVLGVSTVAEFPNTITWMSLGNNVAVNGDMSRRVYRIRLAPRGANPQDRPVTDFRHPDIRGWTLANRSRLLSAALTLVRAWFCAGAVPVRRAKAFGSFEVWEGVAGGVLAIAAVPGFLGNLTEWRQETDYEAQHWAAHFHWLATTFQGRAFTVGQVVERLRVAGRDDPETPPGLEDVTARGYARELGKAYGKHKDRAYGPYILTLRNRDQSHGNSWSVDASGV